MLSAAHTLSLTAISIGAGIAMLWAFGRFSDQERITLAKRKLKAYLYAFRLFADEPALILRAQKQLLIWNGRYLALMLRPAAVMLIPSVILLVQLDAVYGRRPLAAGEATIVTAHLDGDLGVLAPSLESKGVAVETPAVRIPAEHQVCWRVRAIGRRSGSVILRVAGSSVSKTVAIGSGWHYLGDRPFGRRIEVSYPAASVNLLGFGVHWLVWFVSVSLLTMLAFRRRFGVRF